MMQFLFSINGWLKLVSALGGKILTSVSMGSVLQQGFLWWREDTSIRKRAFNCAPTELFLLKFLMRKLRNNMSFVKQTKAIAGIERNKPNKCSR